MHKLKHSPFYDDSLLQQKQRHVKETCETVQQIQNEIESFNMSLDKLIRRALKEQESYDCDGGHFSNGNGESHKNNGHSK